MHTATAILTRRPFVPSVAPSFGASELLAEAAKLLGYQPRLLLERQTLEAKAQNEAILAKALEKLEIEPLAFNSVLSYKALRTKQAKKDQSTSFVRFMHNAGGGEGTIFVAGIVTIMASVATGIGLLAQALGAADDGRAHFLFTHHPWTAWTYGLVALGFTSLYWARHKQAVGITANWNWYRVSSQYEPNNYQNHPYYIEAIPEFALERMLRLKKELPETAFHIEQLDVRKEGLKTQYTPPPDPFLVATYRDISVYLDVWDEPSFEGRRTV